MLIDGGAGQVAAACAALLELGIDEVPVVGVAKGVDRDAGKEEFHRPGQPPMALGHRDPVLYFVQRLRDEAHRFAIGAHRAKRAAQTRATPLDEVPGVGAARKRALLAHFGSAKAVTRAGLADLKAAPGISQTSRRGDLRLLPWRGVRRYIQARDEDGGQESALPMRWTIPNILTVMRLVAAPGVALAFVVFDRPYADWIAFGLFILAALTDYIDGRLARAWQQESNFGRMLDPIADKAMVVIALAVIVGLSGIKPLILVPVAFILLREVFVSGLREFLGAKAGKLKVTYLAKWKTTAQMVAIPVLLLAGGLRVRPAAQHALGQRLVPRLGGVAAVERRAGADLGRGAADADDRLRLPDEGAAVPAGPQAVTLTVRYFAWLRERVGRARGDRRDRGGDGRPSWSTSCAAATQRYALAFADLRGGAGRGRPGAGGPRGSARGRARGGVLPADDRGLNGGPGPARGLRPRRRAGGAARRAAGHRRAGELHRAGARRRRRRSAPWSSSTIPG